MNPVFDWHALAPDIVLTATILLVLVIDLVTPSRDVMVVSRLSSFGVLGALIPIVTLAVSDNDVRSMFDGAYVVDNYALTLKAFFLVSAYITILLSIDYIDEGDYYKSEFFFLILSSTLGMSVMASARDMITLFVALELISIPTFVLAAFRKHDRRSNEAGVKYYLIGVLSSALMLYGMSIVFGLTGSTLLSEINAAVDSVESKELLAVAIFLALAGFAFKVSAVPFHFWAPDTYEGAPTPVTAFLSVSSKAGGFVALLNIIFFGFYGEAGAGSDLWWGAVWVLAALSMVVGNLAALRQTNIVRMLAYSSVAQGGFMLVPFAAAGIAGARGEGEVAQSAFSAVVVYLLIYGAMNLGAFAVVIAAARKTRSAEISSFSGLFTTSPVLAVTMTVFMASLAGIPPLAGWFAKFVMFRSALEAGTAWAVVLAAIAAVASVIAFFYYARVIRAMWFHEPAADAGPGRCRALATAIALTTAITVVIGVYPQLFARVGDLATEFVDAIARLIRREGPIPFETFMELALYGEDGFFTTGGGAGRGGRDFITSPEVGSLFGQCVARSLDRGWRELGEPDPYLVVEAGAGNGRLAADVLRAAHCAPALRYILVERSPVARAEQRTRLPLEPADEALGPFVERDDTAMPVPRTGPVVAGLEALPSLSAQGIVLANELLDNLPVGIAEYDGTRWNEVRVGYDGERFTEVPVPMASPPANRPDDAAAGARIPIPHGVDAWLRECARTLESGYLLLVDYVVPWRELLVRGRGWLRTYRAHGTGGDPLDDPGTQDITTDVVAEQLHDAARAAGFTLVAEHTQADWLRGLGIEELVDAGKRAWEAGAARGDLEALSGRSRVNEAAALTDPDGLGAHRVVLFSL